MLIGGGGWAAPQPRLVYFRGEGGAQTQNLPRYLLVVESVEHAQNKALDFCQLSFPIDRILQNITQNRDDHLRLRGKREA